MKHVKYDINKLAEDNILDTSVANWFFYNHDEYFEKLTDFTEKYTQYLNNYNPTVVVVSDVDRKFFIRECAGIRAVLTQLGMKISLDELNNLENAALAGDIKELDDGLTKFHATLEIYFKHIIKASIKPVPANPPVMLVSGDKKTALSIISALEKNYSVAAFNTGAEAVSALVGGIMPVLFMIDTAITGIGAYELAFIIHEQLRFRDTPLIFLTDEKGRDAVREALLGSLSNTEGYYIKLPVADNSKLLNLVDERLKGFK